MKFKTPAIAAQHLQRLAAVVPTAADANRGLQKLTLRNAIFCIRVASFWKIVPFQLCEKNKLKVELFPTAWKTFLWLMVNAVVLANCSYQVLAFLRDVSINDGLTKDSSIHLGYICMTLLAILYYVTMLTKRKEAVALFNQFDFLMDISTGWLLISFDPP